MSASLFDAAKTISAREVAERYAGVEAKRKGMKYWCRCPMPGHQEKTPSCTFDPNTGKFYCFGCHAGGSSVDFVAQLLGITPKEAAVRICTDYGLAFDEAQPVKKAAPLHVTRGQIDKARTRFDSAAAGYLRFLEKYIASTADPEGEPTDAFARALAERNTMKEICDTLLTCSDDEALELMSAYRDRIKAWEKLSRMESEDNGEE